jgi:7-cyano-7-deazaguanine synthase in queuosine biosynthesis
MNSFFVRHGGNERGGLDHVLDTQSTLYTGETHFKDYFGEPTWLERDLLVLASAIFAADRASARGEREEIARHISLSVPVVHFARLLPLVPITEKILRVLSNDRWSITFRQHAGDLEHAEFDNDQAGRTLLFSGGLDSLAAAVRFSQGPDPLQLVSHITRNVRTKKAQQELVEMLPGDRQIPHYQFFASSREGEEELAHHDIETSQRTRSFLFMTLGALAARRAGHHRLVVLAENGQMAIHLPLTSGRIGAFSTHTAHPDVLVLMQQFLSAALDYPVTIANPFVHLTKAEVVGIVANAVPDSIPVSESCWKNARPMAGGAHHCGECVPCFVRRIAIEHHGADRTLYNRDPWAHDFATLPPDDLGRRNLADLVEFARAMEILDDEGVMAEWPELYSENIDAPETISMYRRFASEARHVLSHYPGLAVLLQ